MDKRILGRREMKVEKAGLWDDEMSPEDRDQKDPSVTHKANTKVKVHVKISCCLE